MENCLLLWFEDEIIGLFTVRMELKHCCVITLVRSTKETNASLTGVVRGVKSGKIVEEEKKKERQGGSKRLSQHLFTELTELTGTAGLIVRSTVVHVSVEGRIFTLCSVNRYIFLSWCLCVANISWVGSTSTGKARQGIGRGKYYYP